MRVNEASGGRMITDPVPAMTPTIQDRAPSSKAGHEMASRVGAVDLYWIPLGAGAHAARITGKVFEAVSAFRQHRPRGDLYHSALELTTPDGRYVVEQTPVPGGDG